MMEHVVRWCGCAGREHACQVDGVVGGFVGREEMRRIGGAVRIDEEVEDDAKAVVGVAEFSNLNGLTHALFLGVEAAPLHDVGG